MPWNTAWRVMTSYSATQAPMLRCFGVGADGECGYGWPSNSYTTDQFGNEGLDNNARMLGPRYPHRWSTDGCENFMQYWMDYQQGVYAPKPITGSVGPVGAPQIAELRASDPDDLDREYSVGDELAVVFSIATDRSNTTQPSIHSGDRLYVDSLFAFNAQLGQDYSGAWSDDSTFIVTILDASWRQGPPFRSNGTPEENNCTAYVRPGVVVRNLASTSPALAAPSPPLMGDVGLDTSPSITSVIGEDPDSGDVTVSYGDHLTIAFSIATDRGCASAGSAPTRVPTALTALVGGYTGPLSTLRSTFPCRYQLTMMRCGATTLRSSSSLSMGRVRSSTLG